MRGRTPVIDSKSAKICANKLNNDLHYYCIYARRNALQQLLVRSKPKRQQDNDSQKETDCRANTAALPDGKGEVTGNDRCKG